MPFLDTNILVYCFAEDRKRDAARALLRQEFETSVQALNELVNVLRKGDASLEKAVHASGVVRRLCAKVHSLVPEDHAAAFALFKRYRIQWWDAVLVATALRAGATTFYSEDMHDGLVIADQMTIINPFRA